MLKMLQMIRNMADFPNMYYIVAGDKKAMTNRLLEKKISELQKANTKQNADKSEKKSDAELFADVMKSFM